MNNSEKSNVQDHSNVQKSDILSITLPMINRMKIEDKSEQTITSYVRAVERLVRFHDLIHPRDLEIDEVYDFLVSLNEKDQVNWRTSKMYVAGLRYYWTHMLDDSEFADKIPYTNCISDCRIRFWNYLLVGKAKNTVIAIYSYCEYF